MRTVYPVMKERPTECTAERSFLPNSHPYDSSMDHQAQYLLPALTATLTDIINSDTHNVIAERRAELAENVAAFGGRPCPSCGGDFDHVRGSDYPCWHCIDGLMPNPPMPLCGKAHVEVEPVWVTGLGEYAGWELPYDPTPTDVDPDDLAAAIAEFETAGV